MQASEATATTCTDAVSIAAAMWIQASHISIGTRDARLTDYRATNYQCRQVRKEYYASNLIYLR